MTLCRFDFPPGFEFGAAPDACRLSPSWARVMPNGVNITLEVLAFYDNLDECMRRRGLKPGQTPNAMTLCMSASKPLVGYRNPLAPPLPAPLPIMIEV